MRRFALLLLLACGSATAADGTYEINAACVFEGCFPGDDPLTQTIEIAESGHYRLTSSILVSEGHGVVFLQGAGGILDLNGYEIRCNDSSPCNSLNGVQLDAGAFPVTVRHGLIAGFRDCVHQDGGHLTVDQMDLRFCADDGVQILRGTVRNTTFVNNTYGIYTLGSTRIIDNFFVGSNASQDPGLFNSESACSGNVVSSGNDNDLDACVFLGENLCGSSLCTSTSSKLSVPDGK